MWRLLTVAAALTLAVSIVVAYDGATVSRAVTPSPSISLVKDETIGDGNPIGDLVGTSVPVTYGVTVTTTGPADTDLHLQVLGPASCDPTWTNPLDTSPDVILGDQISVATMSNVGATVVVAQYTINCSSPGDYEFQITADVTSESVPVDPEPNDNQAENVLTAHVECDADGDGVCTPQDNCPVTPNPGQADNDSDGEGDACDANDDTDAIPDSLDDCPLLAEDVDGVQDDDGCPDTDAGVTVDKDESLTVPLGVHQVHPVSITVTNGNYAADIRVVILAVSLLGKCEVRLIPIDAFEQANHYLEFVTDENGDTIDETRYSQIERIYPSVPANSSLVINRSYDIICYQAGFFPDAFEYQVDVLPELPVVEEMLGDDPRVPPDSPSNNVHKNFPDVNVPADCAGVEWLVPLGDSECDGYPDSLLVGARAGETAIGTDPASNCPATPTPNDELIDSWPVDLNDNQLVNGADILAYNAVFGQPTTNPPVNVAGQGLRPISRFDLNGSGLVNGADVLAFNSFFGKQCQP